MTYSELAKSFKNKFSEYGIVECNAAIKDIDETLKINAYKDMSDPYIIKLFCERDAALDRKMVLQKHYHKASRTHHNRSQSI